MMSQKESPRNHPWVIPKKVACLVWDPDSRLKVNDGRFLLLVLLLSRADILLIGRRKWWVIPSSISALPSSNNSRRNHLSLTINLESGSHTKKATCLGITHGWFLGDSCRAIIYGAYYSLQKVWLTQGTRLLGTKIAGESCSKFLPSNGNGGKLTV